MKTLEKADLNEFQFLKVLGTGAFGAVFLAQYKPAKTYWAFKSLSKANVIEKK